MYERSLVRETVRNTGSDNFYYRWDLPVPVVRGSDGYILELDAARLVVTDADNNNKITQVKVLAIGKGSSYSAIDSMKTYTTHITSPNKYAITDFSFENLQGYKGAMVTIYGEVQNANALEILTVELRGQYVPEV